MANIRENPPGSGNYYVRFRSRSRKPDEKNIPIDDRLYPTARDRKLLKEELELLYRKGEYDPWTDGNPDARRAGPAGGVPVGDAIEEFIRFKTRAGKRGEQRGWSEKTAASAPFIYRHFARRVGQHRLTTSLTQDDLARYIYREGLSDASRRTYRRKLRVLVRWMQRMGYADNLRLPPALRKKKKLPEHIGVKGLGMICGAHVELCRRNAKYAKNASRAGYEDVFRVAFYQARRLSVWAELRRAHISLSAGLMRIGAGDWDTKTDRDQYIPITEPAWPILERRCRDLAPQDRIFGRKTGRPFSDAFRAARRIAFPERERLTFHSLRHSSAIYWLSHGKSIIWTRDLLGHESVETLEVYLRAIGKSLERSFHGDN